MLAGFKKYVLGQGAAVSIPDQRPVQAPLRGRRQAAVQVATERFEFQLDTIVSTGCVENILKHLQTNPNVAIADISLVTNKAFVTVKEGTSPQTIIELINSTPGLVEGTFLNARLLTHKEKIRY